nr:MAG TPA: hypothetical protein [Caudoviricetes sp.]
MTHKKPCAMIQLRNFDKSKTPKGGEGNERKRKAKI